MNASLRLGFALSTGFACAGAAQATAPVANHDSYQTGQGQTMTIAAPGVLGNDTDADMDALTAAVATNPVAGNLTLNADGSFTYEPDADFHGTDTFIYSATGGGESDQAVVVINVTSSYVSGGNDNRGSYGSGAPSLTTLLLLALAAFYPRGLKASKRRAISP